MVDHQTGWGARENLRGGIRVIGTASGRGHRQCRPGESSAGWGAGASGRKNERGLRLGKLIDGVRLALLHPTVAFRSCEHCLRFFYDEKTGKTEDSRRPGPNGEKVPRERGSNEPAPCRNPNNPDGCPKGTPENPKSLSPKNLEAFEHYQRCKAVGRFQDDPIVEDHAALIHQAEQQVERKRQSDFLTQLILGAKVAGSLR